MPTNATPHTEPPRYTDAKVRRAYEDGLRIQQEIEGRRMNQPYMPVKAKSKRQAGMNDDITTAREAAIQKAMDCVNDAFMGVRVGPHPHFIAALARYGLACHVQACSKHEYGDLTTNIDPIYGPKCGDGWYCDTARKHWPEQTGGR